MSKTVVGILEVVAGIALEFVPGFQTAGLALIAAGVGTLLAPGPPKPPTIAAALKTERPPRVSVYGRRRIFGAYVLYVTQSGTGGGGGGAAYNGPGAAIDVWAFHDGRIDAIEAYYLADQPVTLTGGGYVVPTSSGQYGHHNEVQVQVNLGLDTETAFAELLARIPTIWTSNHRGDGVVTGFMVSNPVPAKYFQEVYPSGGPNQTPLAILIRAQLVFDWRDETQSVTDPSTWKWSENFILHLAHYQLVRNNKTWARHIEPTLSYWTAAANDADIPMPLKGVQTATTAIAHNTDTHIVVGAVTGLAAGMTVLITASDDPTHSESRVVSSVSSLTINFSGGLAYTHPLGSGVYWASDPDSPAHEPRYRSCLSHVHAGDAGAHKAVVAAILACGDGFMVERDDGALIVYSGRYYTPTVTLGPDKITGYSIDNGIQDENALNQINVTYVSDTHLYNEVDCDAWIDEDDIAFRGVVRSDDLKNQVPSFAQARRLAKRKLSQVMAPRRGTVSTTSDGNIVVGERYIHLKLVEMEGFPDEFVAFDGPAEITKMARNIQTGAISFVWIEADTNIDAWNPATEEGFPAPVGDQFAREPLDAPTITAATADLADVSGVGTGIRISIDATGPDRADITWFARWRILDAVSWNEQAYADTDPGSAVNLLTSFVPINHTIEVEVAYGIGDGRVSPYSSPSTHVDTTSADTTLLSAGLADLIAAAAPYNSGTTYHKGNFVTDQGSVWIFTNTTGSAGHAPPTLPTVTNAYWDIFAQRGADGVSTYTWIAYADSSDGSVNFTTGAAGTRTYIGLGQNEASPTESTDYHDYSWALFKGADGANGLNNAVVYIYQRSPSGAPTLPSATATYTFATGIVTGLNNGWTAAVPSGSDPLYVSVATASATGATDTIASGEWASAVILAQNGADGSTGAAGAPGLNAATIYIYQRESSAPSLPSATATYTFATGTTTGLNNGWTTAIPSGTDPIYVSTASAASTGATDTISSGEWASVTILARNGSDGTNGTNGSDGTDGYSIAPSGPSIQVKCFADGTPKSGELPISYSFTILRGTTDISTDGGTTYSVSTSGLTGSMGGTNNRVLTVTAIADDTATATVTISVGGVAVGVSISTFSKYKDAVTATNQLTVPLNTIITRAIAAGDAISLYAVVYVNAGGGSGTLKIQVGSSLAGAGSFSVFDTGTGDAVGPTEPGMAEIYTTFTNSTGTTQAFDFQAIRSSTPGGAGGSTIVPQSYLTA